MYEDPLLPLVPRQKWESWPKHLSARRVAYRPLSELLTLAHDTDAHLGAYSAPGAPRRLCTDPPAYARIEGGVPMVVFLIDVDCAAAHRATGGSGKVHADDAWWAALLAKVRRLDEAHPGAFCYRTRGGGRIIYRVPVPHIVHDGASEIGWKKLYLRALAYLAHRFGIVADPSISDWTRLIRLPHVTRDDVFARAETFGDPRAVGVLDVPEDGDGGDLAHARTLVSAIPAWGPALRILAGNALPPARRERAPRLVAQRPAVDPGAWRALAEDLGRALRRHHGRHGLHLAIAGAVFSRGVPPEVGAELGRAIVAVSGETDDRPQVWQTTADRVRAGQAVTGFGQLARHWPDVAAIIDAALPADGGARAARDELDGRGRFLEVPAAEVAGVVRDAIAEARAGLTVVRITEGGGKTRAAAEVLLARAQAAHDYELIPSRAKTVYVAPSHAVALEVASALRGSRAVYWRSVLAVRDGAGDPECHYHVALSAVVRARHNVVTWCEGKGMGRNGADSPCPHLDDCPARAGTKVALGEPGRPPAVMVTVHALLGEALRWAGRDALVIIDEDPQPVEAAALTRAELDAAAGAEDLFAYTERWRAPVLRALAAGLERGDLPRGAGQLAEVFARGCAALEGDEAWREDVARSYPDPDPAAMLTRFAILAAWFEVRKPDAPAKWQRRSAWAPRPHPRERSRVFHGKPSDRFVAASEAHASVARLVAGVLRAAPEGVVVHGERGVAAVEVSHNDATRRVLRGVLASPAICSAFRRWGPTVLLDATADLAVVGAVAGGRVPALDVRVADGAPVTRRLFYWSGASRRGSLEDGRARWEGGLLRYVRAALAQAFAAGARLVGLFTWLPLADALRAAQAGSADDPTAADLLAWVRAAGAELVVGHYGHARGRNDWQACDALVSVGDPRPNLGATRAIAAVLGLSDDHGEVYRRATSAEVSQVAGRLRAPWRTAPALHVHVGTVAPSSWDARAEVLDLPQGVARGVDPDAVLDAVRVYGTQRAGAAAADVSHRSAKRAVARAESMVSHRRFAVPTIAGNTLPASVHPQGQVTPVRNTSMGASGPACDSLETKRFTPSGASAGELIDAMGGAAAVAALLGVGRATVYHWRSGARPMPPEARQRLVGEVQRAAPASLEQPPAATGGAPGRFELPPVEEASSAW